MMKLKNLLLSAAIFGLFVGSVIYALTPMDQPNQWAVGSDTLGIVLDSSGNLVPNVDEACSLGTSTYEWNNLRIDGTATVDILSIDETSTFTGVATFTGVPVFNGGIDVNEDVDIDFNAGDEEFNITISSGQTTADSATVTIYSSTGDVVGAEYLLRLRYKDDADTDADFLVCEDNDGDDMLYIDSTGGIYTAGDIDINGNNLDLGDANIDYDSTNFEVDVDTAVHITATGVTIGAGLIVSTAAASAVSLEFAGAFVTLPTSGYNEGTLAYDTTNSKLNIATATVNDSGDWVAVH